jgi:hypothetical protein
MRPQRSRKIGPHVRTGSRPKTSNHRSDRVHSIRWARRHGGQSTSSNRSLTGSASHPNNDRGNGLLSVHTIVLRPSIGLPLHDRRRNRVFLLPLIASPLSRIVCAAKFALTIDQWRNATIRR